MLTLLLACTPTTLDEADSSAPDTSTDSAAPADSGETAEPPILPDAPFRVYAVRHAEKGSGTDPDLTEEGHARAQALATLLHDVELHAAYATEYLRTQQTVQPTADDHGLKVHTELDPEEELAHHLLGEHGGDTVVHAGHSTSLGDFFYALGAESFDPVDGYGQLWILDVDVTGEVVVELSSYGE